jgi:hypothetical protein
MARAANIAGIGCGAVLLLGMCGASIATYVAIPARARDAAHGLLADVRASSWSSALQRTSPTYQRSHDARALEQAVRAMPRLAGHTGATFWNASFEREGDPPVDTAVLDGTIETPDGALPLAVELIDVEGYWYVEALVIEGRPLE